MQNSRTVKCFHVRTIGLVIREEAAWALSAHEGPPCFVRIAFFVQLMETTQTVTSTYLKLRRERPGVGQDKFCG